MQVFANALEEAARAEEFRPVLPAQESAVQSQFLHPTLIVSPGKYEWQPTEKADSFSTFPPSAGTQSPQLQEISRTPVLSTKALPFRKRLRYAFNAGSTGGIFSALLHIVTVLLNASTFREARQEILRNTLTVNTAFGVVVVQSLNLFVSLLIYFVVGFVIGKIVTRRSFGFLTGALAGTILFIATFLVSSLSAYPATRMLEGLIGTDMVGNGIVIALVFLCIWSITGGLVSLLGAWVATRKHPDYM
jgi:hypothetical protein